MQKELFERFVRQTDVIYTPEEAAKAIIKFLNPWPLCLDPCRGNGAFHKNMHVGAEYCEISEGNDFFDYVKRVEWIIGNPPYSNLHDFLYHSFNLAENVSYLIPVNKLFQNQIVMNMINNYGGIKSMLIFGDARRALRFPFGFSVGNFHFQRGYKGDCRVIIGNEVFRKINYESRF
jgi:hypothetical protein